MLLREYCVRHRRFSITDHPPQSKWVKIPMVLRTSLDPAGLRSHWIKNFPGTKALVWKVFF